MCFCDLSISTTSAVQLDWPLWLLLQWQDAMYVSSEALEKQRLITYILQITLSTSSGHTVKSCQGERESACMSLEFHF